MFRQNQRLTRKRDLDRIYKQGQSAGSRLLFVRTIPNRSPYPRFGVVIGKKVAKKAVVRNRLKRLVRQAITELYLGPTGQPLPRRDYLITIHRIIEPLPTLEQVKQEVTTCFAKLPSV